MCASQARAVVRSVLLKDASSSSSTLRIAGAAYPLDESAVHPERYPLVEKIASDLGVELPALIGNPERVTGKTPVTLNLGGALGVVGSSVRVFDSTRRCVGSQLIGGGDGRGSQQPLQARFALQPGSYRVVTRFSSGFAQVRDIRVGTNPVRTTIDDDMPPVD